jgi:hypothetical protein
MITFNVSNQMLIGSGSYHTFMYGNQVWIDADDYVRIHGDTGVTLTADGSYNISLTPSSGDVVIPYTTSYAGRGSSTTIRNLIKKASDNATEIGWAGAHDVRLLSTTKIDCSAGGHVLLPYVGSAPSGLSNGSMWMESDGLHIRYNGSEYTVAGV